MIDSKFLLATFFTFIFFIIGNYIDAKAAICDGTWKSFMYWSMITAIIWIPMMPVFFWAFHQMTQYSNKIWVAQLVLFFCNMSTAALLFYLTNNEIPNKGTLVGIILALLGVICAAVWK